MSRANRYSIRFNEMFEFFFKSYRAGILDFCGSEVNVEFDINGMSAKKCFKLFENGQLKVYKSKHSNILKGVIIGKKAWGLWLQQWTDGISEFLFTKEVAKDEILWEFESRGIKIPERLMVDFDNILEKKHIDKYKQNKEFLNALYGRIKS